MSADVDAAREALLDLLTTQIRGEAAIDAFEAAVRSAALDEARAAVERERLIEGLANDGDTAYNHAIDDALAAIDALREGADKP